MPSSGRSPLHEGRYAVLRQKKAASVNYFLLGGVLIVFAFFATLLMLHFLSQGFFGKASIMKDNSDSKRKPYTGLLESQCPAVCYTKECLRTAAQVFEMLDPTADPCEDFNLYACGGYKRVPADYDSRLVYLWYTEQEAVKIFRDLIKKIPKSVPSNVRGSSLSKLRRMYDSCMDTETIEENSIPTAFKHLDQFGIKPWQELESDFTFSDPDLDEVLIGMAFYQQEPFFRVKRGVSFLFYNQTATGLTFGFKSDRDLKIMMSRRDDAIFHTEGSVEKDKMTFIEEVLEHVLPNATLRNEILEDVLSFDLELHDIIKKSSEKEQQCMRSSPGGDCSSTLSYDCREGGNHDMDRWCKITKEILDRSGFSKKNSSIPVLLKDPEFFQELEILLNNTNQRTIARALTLQFFTNNAFFMNAGLSRNAKLSNLDLKAVRKRYLEKMPETGRSEFCTIWAGYRLPILMEAAFYSGNTELRNQANEIYSYVKQASSEVVEEMKLGDDDLQEALETVHTEMNFYPEMHWSYVSDLSKVDALHQEVLISEESFLANELESRKHGNTLNFKNLDDMKATILYYAVPYEFDAAFDDSFPAVEMEVGNLVFPDFATDRPRYANFAFLGYVIGHEIAHGVAIELYPLFEKLKSEALENALRKKEECLANHYSQYDVYNTGVKVNGNYTFHENLADYFGVRSAFKAFQRYQETHGTEQMLPGLPFSNEQMFFILHAQVWCAAHTQEGVEYYFKESHSPPNVRILGMDKNYDAFSEAFNCAPGSPMNPISKC